MKAMNSHLEVLDELFCSRAIRPPIRRRRSFSKTKQKKVHDIEDRVCRTSEVGGCWIPRKMQSGSEVTSRDLPSERFRSICGGQRGHNEIASRVEVWPRFRSLGSARRSLCASESCCASCSGMSRSYSLKVTRSPARDCNNILTWFWFPKVSGICGNGVVVRKRGGAGYTTRINFLNSYRERLLQHPYRCRLSARSFSHLVFTEY